MTHGGQSKMMAVALIWESTKGNVHGEVDKSWKTFIALSNLASNYWMEGSESLPSWIELDLKYHAKSCSY